MLKLALLQCNVKNTDLSGNARKILELAALAPDGAICVAPLPALTGPDFHCLVSQPDYGPRARATLTELASGLPPGRPLLLSLPGQGHFLLEDGNIQPIPAVFTYGGARICLEGDPEQCGAVDLLLDLQGRPFSGNCQAEWELILSGASRQSGFWAASVNLCGGYDSRIFNGQSVIIAPDGSLTARAKAFAEDCLALDLAAPGAGRIEPLCACLEEAQWHALVLGLRDFFAKNGAEKAIIGLSGGMDSALVACIANAALGAENIVGVLMPSCYTSAASLTDARQMAANLGIKTTEIPIEPLVQAFLQSLAPGLAVVGQRPGNLMAENLQARIRGNILMSLANVSGAFVLNTGNKSESAMGYCTLHGDMVGSIAVIGDLFKTQVYALAAWHCRQAGMIIPQNVFDRPPSAELAPGQKDTDSLPPYDQLDADLAKIMAFSPQLESDAALRALRQRMENNGFKRRQAPPALLVSGLQPCAGDWR